MKNTRVTVFITHQCPAKGKIYKKLKDCIEFSINMLKVEGKVLTNLRQAEIATFFSVIIVVVFKMSKIVDVKIAYDGTIC